MRNLGRDVTFAWRRLKSSPFFTAFAVGSLALGIGVVTAIYSVVETALAPPPGIHDVDRIVNVSHYPRGSVPMTGISLPDFEDYRARQTVLDEVAAWGQLRASLVSPGRARTAFCELVSGNYFTLLGVHAALGRTIQPADDAASQPPVVVLGHALWQQMFDGRTDVIGRTIKIGGTTFEVIGVAPREFKGQFNNGLIPTAAWLPLSTAPAFPELGTPDRLRDRERRWLRVQGRLGPGATLEQVSAEVTAIAKALDREFPIGADTPARMRLSYATSRPWSVTRLVDLTINQGAAPLVSGLAIAMTGALGLVLLVACTNLANLVLARGSTRRHEQAVRLALGATRWRLVREGLVETMLLAGAGGVAGLGLARVLMLGLGREVEVGNGASLLIEPHLDPKVLAVAFGATLLALVVAGLVPSWLLARPDVRGVLAADGAGAALPRWRGRRLLITAQVAVSVILLAVTALFVSQVRTQNRLDSGIDLARLAVAEVDFREQRIDDNRTRQVVTAALDRLAREPGIDAVAASSGLPVGITTPMGSIVGPGGARVGVAFVSATPGIFRTLGLTLVAGRAFDARDTAASAPVVVVNETTARLAFGRTDVVGRALTVQRARWVGEEAQPAAERTIVGVAADSDSGVVGRRDQGVIYLPWDQQFEGRLVISARTGADPSGLVGRVRQALLAVEPDLGITQIGTGQAVAGPSNLFAEVTAGVSGLLGAFGLVLALAGLSGVLSHVVARRRREMGVRLALGATPREVRRLVLREGLEPVVVGLLAGGALAVIARLSLRPMFSQLVPSMDVVSLCIVPIVLLAAGVVACWLPARRASRVDPSTALRDL